MSVPPAPEDPLWREEVLDSLRSLRTAVALLGVLALVAVGVAVWALLSSDDDGGGGSGGGAAKKHGGLRQRLAEKRCAKLR